MPRYVKNSDGETDAKTGCTARGIVSTGTVDSPLRRSSRVKSAAKQNESSESPSSDCSNVSNTQSVKNKRRRSDTLNNSTMTKRSRSLRLRRSYVSDAIETPDKQAAIATPTKRTRNIFTNDGVNKSDDQTSFSKRLTRSGSDSKSPQITTRPVRRTRASSVGPEGVMENNVSEVHNSGLVHNTLVNTRKRRSVASSEATVIEENEEKMIPFVTLGRLLPHLKEMNETCSENSTTETLNKSISNSKEMLNSNSENISKEEMKPDGNAKNEHATPVEHSSAEIVQENETSMSINKSTLSDISEKSRSESTHTITQMKTSILDVPKTQSPITTEVTPRKLQLKNESSINNSIKEEDKHLSNKENRATNIIENPESNEVTGSNMLSQSPQQLIVSDVCTDKSVNENDEDSSDNEQHLVVTDTESLSEIPLNVRIGRSTLCIQICEDSSLDENIQIMKCPENVNNINSLRSLNDDDDQNALSVEIQDDSNQDGGIPIHKYEKNISDSHTDKSFKFNYNKKDQIQHTTSDDENTEMRLILEAEETVNEDKEKPKEVCLTQITTADAKCDGNIQAGVSNTPEDLNDTGVIEYSKLSDMSVDKISTSLITSTGESTTNDLQETEMAMGEITTYDLQGTEMDTGENSTNDLQETEIAMDETTTNDLQETEVAGKVPSRESITKEPFDVHTQSNNFEVASENENSISNVIENSDCPNVAQALVEAIDKATEKVDVTQHTSKVDNCLASEEKSIIDSNSQNDIEKNGIADTVQKQEENMQTDDNLSDAHIGTDLFQDIPADEWKNRNCDKNSVHSMSTERLENESENECNDFVLVDQEISETAENIEKEKESSDYDSDDTVLLKTRKNALKEKTVERMDMSESQCETNENKSAKVKDTQQSMQQEKVIAAEANSENQKEHVENQTEEVQNAENVSTKTSITNEVSKQSPLESDNCIEKPAVTNLTNEIDQTLDTELSLNKKKSKSSLSKDGSNEIKFVCKSVEKSDSEVEEPSEVDAKDEKDSLSKSPIGSPSNVSESNKTDESMDSDIEREYNLNGEEVCKFSDDDVPGDECRASETESSEPDDNGLDLEDFVVNNDGEISEEVESNELDEESSTGHADKHLESDKDATGEQRGKIQMQHENDEKEIKHGILKRIDRLTSKKEKKKFKKSEKLGLDKITESEEKITSSEIETIGKKKKRKKIKKCVEEEEIDEKELAERSRKVEVHEEEIARKMTKKGQRRRSEYVEGIENNCTDIPKKKKSKLRKTTKIDLPEMSESGKNVKRKSEIETGKKMKKIIAKDNGNKMLKEKAAVIRENRPTECTKVEVSSKRVKRLAEEVIENLSDLPMKISKKRKLLKPEQKKLPSRSIPRSELRKRNVNVQQDFIPLSSYGSTSNFYIANLQTVKKSEKTSEVKLFRQKMLNKNPRQPISYYTMVLEKQAASNKH